MVLDPKKILAIAPLLENLKELEPPALEKKFGQANKKLLEQYNGLHDDSLQEDFDKIAKKIVERSKEIAEARKNTTDIEDDVHDVPAQMNIADFKKKLLKISGVEAKGKDGKNHDIMKKGSRTTSLGLDGHGTKTTSKNMRIYLKQLGVSVSDWDKVK